MKTKMNTLLSKLPTGLIALGILTSAVSLSGCENQQPCYDPYYCNYYYGPYDPYYDYGYSYVYYEELPEDTYGTADPSVAEKAPEKVVNVEHLAYVAKTGSAEDEGVSAKDFDEHYPCGGESALVLCADPKAAVDDSEQIVVTFRTEGTIPVADPENSFVLGFAFDADGDASNNFVPPAKEAGDYFGKTDKWYKITYEPKAGWKLAVLDASTDAPKSVASRARFIIDKNVAAIVIPASEFEVATPALRISLLRHTTGADWSGLAYPKPGEPLLMPKAE